MFAGPAGVGKTTSAVALARELYGDSMTANFLELNASDERGIGIVRGRIKEFARAAGLQSVPFKIIFLDEADALTSEAQAALRRTMEQFASVTRFILSCNYSSKIIEPIQSRCAVFRFRPLKPEEIKAMIRKVAKNEGLEISQDGVDAIIYVARGDLRKAINSLQVAATVGKSITEDVVFETTATAHPEEVRKLVETALKGDFLAARTQLDELLITYGLSGEDVVRQIHRSVFDLPVSDAAKVRLIDRIGEAEFRLVEGSNERVQIEALLAHFVLVGAEVKSLSPLPK
jgi:replication factor C small subunit